MQPSDGALFDFKKFYNSATDTWMVNHPGRTITIYDIRGLIGDAFPKAFTRNNIVRGFRKSGIEPFHPDIFTDGDFIGSNVTDREDPNQTPELAVIRLPPSVTKVPSPGISDEIPTTSNRGTGSHYAVSHNSTQIHIQKHLKGKVFQSARKCSSVLKRR